MKKLFTLFLCTFSSISCFCQLGQDYNVRSLKVDVKKANFNYNKSIEGSAFLEEDFTDGIFYIKNGDPTERKTRLNLFEKSFEFKEKDVSLLVVPNSVDSIRYKNSIYVFIKFDYNDREEVQVLKRIARTTTGGVFEFREVIFNDAVSAKAFQDPIPAKFEQLDLVYVLEFKAKVVALSTIARLYKAFPEQETELKNYVKMNNVKKNDPEKLKELLKFMEQIIH